MDCERIEITPEQIKEWKVMDVIEKRLRAGSDDDYAGKFKHCLDERIEQIRSVLNEDRLNDICKCCFAEFNKLTPTIRDRPYGYPITTADGKTYIRIHGPPIWDDLYKSNVTSDVILVWDDPLFDRQRNMIERYKKYKMCIRCYGSESNHILFPLKSIKTEDLKEYYYQYRQDDYRVCKECKSLVLLDAGEPKEMPLPSAPPLLPPIEEENADLVIPTPYLLLVEFITKDKKHANFYKINMNELLYPVSYYRDQYKLSFDKRDKDEYDQDCFHRLYDQFNLDSLTRLIGEDQWQLLLLQDDQFDDMLFISFL